MMKTVEILLPTLFLISIRVNGEKVSRFLATLSIEKHKRKNEKSVEG
jgi:hypothetical protein